MSNKAEVQINGVHIYTHLGGGNVKQRVADAITKARSVEEPDHLARVIIDEMEKDATGHNTGIGVGPSSFNVLPRIHLQLALGRVTVIDWANDVYVYAPIQEFVDEWASEEQP